MEKEIFDEWVIIEVFGHRRLVGHATEATILGGALLRLDIPKKEGGFITQFIGPSSIFSMTPTTEAIARAVAINYQPEPVNRWELPQLQGSHSPDGLDEEWCPGDINESELDEDNADDEGGSMENEDEDGD